MVVARPGTIFIALAMVEYLSGLRGSRRTRAIHDQGRFAPITREENKKLLQTGPMRSSKKAAEIDALL
jgi:hypothetical protein